MRGILVLLSVSVSLTTMLVAARWREETVLQFAVEEIVEGKIEETSSVAEEDAHLFKMLMSPESKLGTSRLGTFKYKDCSNPKTQQITLSKLELSPDPLSFPGTLYVTFAGAFKTTLDKPLGANLILQKRIGSNWIKIPCLGQIGSCTYDDICELLRGAVCPPPFIANKVPCKCPFMKGDYSFSNAAFEVDAAVFPNGDYYASANLTFSGATVGCLELWVSFD